MEARRWVAKCYGLRRVTFNALARAGVDGVELVLALLGCTADASGGIPCNGSPATVPHTDPWMRESLLAGSVLVAGLMFALQLAKANWVCGPDECVWVQHVHVVEPSFAVNWAPPIHAGCFWKRGIFGRWKFICP